MKVDLHNFFKYYDEKNPKHVAAVEQLEKDLLTKAADLLEDKSNWIRIYRTRIETAKSNILQVPYFLQTDNYRDANRTCNSSCCAMCLEYFKPGTLKGPKGDDEYIRKVFSIGDTTNHDVQTKVLKSYGIESNFHYNLTFDDLDSELNQGRPIVIGILHRGTLTSPTGGHMVVVIGKTANGDYVVNDPYGSLNDGYTSDPRNGKGAVYKRSHLSARWCPKVNDGWGRIFNANKTEVSSLVKTDIIPQSAIDLIKEFEGCKLKAYPDPLTGGKPITIGWGSTRRKDGTRFLLGDVITQQEADELLNHQLKTDFLPSLQKIPHWNEMSDNMKSALISFAYNLGANFYDSNGFNTITKVLKNKEWDKVPDALYLYRNPGTNVEAGLARRRKAEGDLWKR